MAAEVSVAGNQASCSGFKDFGYRGLKLQASSLGRSGAMASSIEFERQ